MYEEQLTVDEAVYYYLRNKLLDKLTSEHIGNTTVFTPLPRLYQAAIGR